MPSSFVSTGLQVTALLVFLFGLASQKHAVISFADRATFSTTIVSCFNRVTTKEIDAFAPHEFYLSQNEWKIFKVFQDADIGCDCQVMCYDARSRVDMYLTFERRPRLNDNWDGWDCDATLPSNNQTCNALAPEPNSHCRVAVHGDSFERPHSKCSITCNVDIARNPCIANPADPTCFCLTNPVSPTCLCLSTPTDPSCLCITNPANPACLCLITPTAPGCFCITNPADPSCNP
jgi:hypothetical protein